MRICLYDWSHGGHHPGFMRVFAQALLPDNDVVVAASDPMLRELSDLQVEAFSLGSPRPTPGDSFKGGDGAKRFRRGPVAQHDIAHLRRVVQETGADVVLVMYLDAMLRRLILSPGFDQPVAACLHHPRFHYRGSYGSAPPLAERLRARVHWALTNRWRARPDAVSVFSLDPEATRLLNRHRRLAPVHFIGEPPIPNPPEATQRDARSGCMIFGHIDHRKGLDRIVRALAGGAEGLELAIVGRNAPEFEEELKARIGALEAGGVSVTRTEQIENQHALGRIGSVRCVILAFGLVPAGSRVLLEAATMGTPVVAPDWGLIGHLVRSNGLGLVVDPDDPAAIREAILRLESDVSLGKSFEPGLSAYVERNSWQSFRATVRKGLGARSEDLSRQGA